jgi:hypothetical protein
VVLVVALRVVVPRVVVVRVVPLRVVVAWRVVVPQRHLAHCPLT